MADDKDIAKVADGAVAGPSLSGTAPRADADDKQKAEAQPRPGKLPRVLAVLAALLAVAAWCVFFFDGLSALVLAVLSVVGSLAGLRSGKGCLRDVAVTALVASGVLIVVYGFFAWGLPYIIAKI